MNEKEPNFITPYRGSLKLIIVEQSLLGILTAMMLDGGVLLSMFLSSFIAYWAGFAMIIVRRPKHPTKPDVF